MSYHYFGKDFAKKFRNECELYSTNPEYQQGNLLIKQFTGDDTEMVILGERLTEKFFKTELISQITLTLRNEDIPATRKLFDMTTTFKNVCKAFLHIEPYAAPHYHDLIAMFDSFSRLIYSFNMDFDKKVCGQLTTYYVHGSSENIVAESSSLIPVIELTDFYLNNISAYYNYFIDTWQYEANNNKSIALPTHMADYLQALMMYTQKTIASIENTRSLLLAWEAQMQIKEEQELYN
ncbi:MAG TPA: hypothetical protein VF008_05125 [Niastella sp.]